MKSPYNLRVPSLTLQTLSYGEGVSNFVKDVTLTLGTRLFGIVTGVFTLTITSRLLGPEGRGQFAVVMTAVALVLQFSNLGLPSSATYHLSRHPELRKEVGGLLFWYSVAAVSIVATLAYTLANLYPALTQSVPLGVLRIAFLSAPPAMFLLLAGNAFLGLGSAIHFNLFDLCVKIISLISVGVLIWWPLEGMFLVYALLHVLIAGFAYGRLLGLAPPCLPASPMVRAIFAYGTRAFLATFFMFLVLRIDLFLVNSILGTAQAGQYSVAVQVGEILSLASASIGAMLFPRLSAMESKQRWASTRTVTLTTAILLAVGAGIVAVLARPMFHVWLGREFLPASVALWWLLPGLWCLGINTILYQHLAASGLPWFLVTMTFLASAVNILLNWKMIPLYGIAGAAAASSASYALLLLSTFWCLKRQGVY